MTTAPRQSRTPQCSRSLSQTHTQTQTHTRALTIAKPSEDDHKHAHHPAWRPQSASPCQAVDRCRHLRSIACGTIHRPDAPQAGHPPQATPQRHTRDQGEPPRNRQRAAARRASSILARKLGGAGRGVSGRLALVPIRCLHSEMRLPTADKDSDPLSRFWPRCTGGVRGRRKRAALRDALPEMRASQESDHLRPAPRTEPLGNTTPTATKEHAEKNAKRDVPAFTPRDFDRQHFTMVRKSHKPDLSSKLVAPLELRSATPFCETSRLRAKHAFRNPALHECDFRPCATNPPALPFDGHCAEYLPQS